MERTLRNLTLAALFVSLAPSSHAQSFQDASFETPVIATGGFVSEPTGSPWLYTGSSSRDSGIANGSSPWGQGAVAGQQYAFIQRDSSISQTVSNLVPGSQYQLKFAMARRNGGYGADVVNQIEIDKDGTALNVVRAVDEVWRNYTSPVFTATSSSATFKFNGLITANDVASLLDVVSITSAPKITGFLQNGGFEIPNFAKGGWNYETNYLDGGGWYFSPQTSFNIGAGTASAGSPWGGAAFAGNQFAYVQRSGFISQTLQNLTVGKKYYVTFEDATRPGFGSHGLRVMVDNTQIMNTISNSNAWQLRQTSSFTATSSSMTLAFDGIDANADASSLLDDVRVIQAVPEPSGVTFGIGCALVLIALRRQRGPRRKFSSRN